jgi:hypothetical protein
MCKCGCNSCETKSTALVLNESIAPKAILSEGLKHHIDTNKPLTEHLYRAGSSAYFNLIAEARSLYSRGILEFTNEDDLAILTETDLGHFGMFEGKKVPLDFPIELNEQMDIYDDIANSEFGMDYDQLGSNEKEWVRDEMDNMEMKESVVNEGNSFDMLEGQGADTAWEDGEGNKVTLQDILDMAKNVPQKDYPTEKLSKVVLNWDNNPEEVERIGQVEVSKQYPILIMVDESGKIQWILDGNHRAQKALRSKAETIPAKLIKPSMLDAKAKKVLLGVVDENVLSEESVVTEARFKVAGRPVEVNQGKKADGTDWTVTFKNGKTFPLSDVLALIKPFPKGIKKLDLSEAKKKKGKNENKPIGKPMRDTSGGKAYKVYVRDPKTKKVKTVRFGSGGLRAKINDSKARAAFAARHKCSTKKDKTKAGYWSCRLPRYAKLLGLKSSFSGFW